MEPPWNVGFTLEVAAVSQGDISGDIPREMAMGPGLFAQIGSFRQPDGVSRRAGL